MSIRQTCGWFGTSEMGYRYRPKLATENDEIAQWLIKLTREQSGWGFGLCFDYLRNVKGFIWNHKRVYHIYCELTLSLQIRPRHRFNSNKPEPLRSEIRIDYIQPGNPQQNAYIERHNRTMRYSWVSKHLFDTLEDVQNYAT